MTKLPATTLFLVQLNNMRRLWKENIPLPINASTCGPIFDRLRFELIPEQLCAGGIRTKTESKKRAAILHLVWEEMENEFNINVDKNPFITNIEINCSLFV